MSASKYADLPDIDTAQDIYETEDVVPALQTNGDSTDDESFPPRATGKQRPNDPTKEDIDASSLIDPEEATKRFRKAERSGGRLRSVYKYPPSPTAHPELDDDPTSPRSLSLSHRLRALQKELTALEHELADPSNPLLQLEKEENNVDPGQLIRDLVDVRARLDKIRKGKEGKGKLVGLILQESDIGKTAPDRLAPTASLSGSTSGKPLDTTTVVDLDHRVGNLERLVGSSSTILDESSPLPPPLLPLIIKLSSQLSLLTQPRHIDSISRRLKLLLSDLDRASISSQHHTHKRNSSQTQHVSQIQDQVMPVLARLGPSLPQIPHILTRLRTLSTLHSSAGEFHATLQGLEQEQQKVHQALLDLQQAVDAVERSLRANRDVVKTNVAGLDSRVDHLLDRVQELQKPAEVVHALP